MELLVATRNGGKLKEIRRLLGDLGIAVKGLDAFPDLPEVEEDGATFAENAVKKAETVCRLTGVATLADDSGLAVAALDGAPGVYSARYAGAGATDADNNRKLLAALAGVPDKERQGAFHCAMALARPDTETHVFHGRVEGLILDGARGEGGFGYDPLFLVREYGKTMAELPLEVKNRISHRGQALRQVVEFLKGGEE
ncbi:XTP/dITP diphosphatase [Trichloromonas sp.]|uniref:XTP/dITP diphosphatase n=1 Tax=Trichloromonas sp. TaxID=3069249 RepID=UPI002A3ABFF8|nr:XTP/dITP diphosphatase [Trichloromonas sp.]